MTHHFMTVTRFPEGNVESHVSCFRCGGMWQVAGDGRASGAFAQSLTGDLAVDCRGVSTNPNGGCHHYAGECASSICDIDSECNCLICYS